MDMMFEVIILTLLELGSYVKCFSIHLVPGLTFIIQHSRSTNSLAYHEEYVSLKPWNSRYVGLLVGYKYWCYLWNASGCHLESMAHWASATAMYADLKRRVRARVRVVGIMHLTLPCSTKPCHSLFSSYLCVAGIRPTGCGIQPGLIHTGQRQPFAPLSIWTT